ncbi:hypothetical protein ACR82Z_04570 [Mycoplasma sp. 6243]|uniref:hypothetical protein n=1 Tax=Mycoplasma sp. 6243 TaxID=3440865 RepID=UPI003EBACF3C
MNKQQIQSLFDKHFKSIGSYFTSKITTNQIKQDIYHCPNDIYEYVYGCISNTKNIRYGYFLEDVINFFLFENGATLNKNDQTSNIDLVFEMNNTIYIGEIKIRDNHDSTKKHGQIQNLMSKVTNYSSSYSNIVVLLYFIDPSQNKNYNFYKNELNKLQDHLNLKDAKVLYGDQLFEYLNLSKQWCTLKQQIVEFNHEIVSNNYINSLIFEHITTTDDLVKKIDQRILKILKYRQD